MTIDEVEASKQEIGYIIKKLSDELLLMTRHLKIGDL